MSATKYQQEDGGDSERPLKVCAEAGRKCVKNIHQYPILSSEWIALVDSLKQLTRLVQLEGRMPANTKVSEAQGRNNDSDGTLWDQESHETAIRILVEEAKPNLCLRMINEFKSWHYNATQKEETFARAERALDYTRAQLESRVTQFEESMGVLLRNAFMHVEALQLMDIPLLVEHCALILQRCATGASEPSDPRLQESIVLSYFTSLMKHAESLNNPELLAKTRELDVVQLTVEHILKFQERFTLDILAAAMEGFAAMADNEDFSSEWESFFMDTATRSMDEAKRNFLALEKIADAVIKANDDKKKVLRPLLDLFKKIERSVK